MREPNPPELRLTDRAATHTLSSFGRSPPFKRRPATDMPNFGDTQMPKLSAALHPVDAVQLEHHVLAEHVGGR